MCFKWQRFMKSYKKQQIYVTIQIKKLDLNPLNNNIPTTRTPQSNQHLNSPLQTTTPQSNKDKQQHLPTPTNPPPLPTNTNNNTTNMLFEWFELCGSPRLEVRLEEGAREKVEVGAFGVLMAPKLLDHQSQNLHVQIGGFVAVWLVAWKWWWCLTGLVIELSDLF